MIQPSFLHPGDVVAIVTPSGKVDSAFIDGAVTLLRQWGYLPRVMPHARGVFGRYGGTVEERLADLHASFADPQVKAILCSRGGYGAIQLLEQLDYRLFTASPKWIIGYSDITALHAWSQQHGVVSLHAPMARHLTEEGADDVASASLFNCLSGDIPTYYKGAHPLDQEGEATATLRGGNLSVLSALRATPYDLPLQEDSILFIEDIAEQPYHVQRMLLNLRLSGLFSRLQGVIVGQFTSYNEDPSMTMTLNELILDTFSGYTFPVCFDFPVGHVAHNFALPCGMPAHLSVTQQGTTLTFDALSPSPNP